MIANPEAAPAAEARAHALMKCQCKGDLAKHSEPEQVSA